MLDRYRATRNCRSDVGGGSFGKWIAVEDLLERGSRLKDLGNEGRTKRLLQHTYRHPHHARVGRHAVVRGTCADDDDQLGHVRIIPGVRLPRLTDRQRDVLARSRLTSGRAEGLRNGRELNQSTAGAFAVRRSPYAHVVTGSITFYEATSQIIPVLVLVLIVEQRSGQTLPSSLVNLVFVLATVAVAASGEMVSLHELYRGRAAPGDQYWVAIPLALVTLALVAPIVATSLRAVSAEGARRRTTVGWIAVVAVAYVITVIAFASTLFTVVLLALSATRLSRFR